MCSKGTSSACSLSVCEKMSPPARGLTGGKLQRIEESVSVKMARGGARSDVVALPLSGEDLGSSEASGSKVTALSKWSCAVARREHEMAMVQIFRRSQDLANVAAGEQSVGKLCVAQTSAKTLRNSVDVASTLKPSCRRGSRVWKKPSKVEVVKREHRNFGPRISSHNTSLKEVRGELPIGSVARNTGCFAGWYLFQRMNRTFGSGPRVKKKAFFGVWDRIFWRKRRQISGNMLKQGFGRIDRFGTIFWVHG